MKKAFKGFEGLDYVTVVANVKKSKNFKGEEIIMANLKDIRFSIAVELIENRVPICGQEVRVIKGAMEMSYDAIATKMGVTKNSILNWTKEPQKRLSAPYEIAFRLLAAEVFGLKLRASLDDLRADDKAKRIKIDEA